MNVTGRRPSDPEFSTRSLVEKFFADWSAGRIDEAFALCDPAGTWWTLSSRSEMPMSAMLARYRTVFLAGVVPGGVRFELGPITSEGDRVAVIAESSGELIDGNVYQNMYHFLFELAGHRIVRVREYCDTHYVRTVLGRLSPPNAESLPDGRHATA